MTKLAKPSKLQKEAWRREIALWWSAASQKLVRDRFVELKAIELVC